MANIKLLDQSLINKIAAGEVIERPASVVKELIENAIDADASQITVEVKEGGKSFIKVSDNGNGMGKEDLKISIERHSTSKIKDVNDLFNINTLGFRGEALASIGAVSQLSIISKTIDKDAHQISVENGKIIEEKTVGAPQGTIVEVNNLFFNTPARKKYLKTIQQELSHITDIVTRYALINYKIFFKLIHNGNVLINSAATDSLLNNIVEIYGKDVAKDLIEIDYKVKNMHVKGYVAKPSTTRSDKNHISVYVNGRYIYNKTITNALMDAFHTLLNVNRYPVAVINIEIDAGLIDVNVHPTKKEIRLSIENQIYENVFTAIRNTLTKAELIPDIREEEMTQKVLVETITAVQKQKPKANFVKQESQVTLQTTDSIIDDEKLPIRILGIVHNCYIIGEDKEGFVVIDQHAAHERVLYEKFMMQLFDKNVKTQQLISPIHVELSPSDSLVLKGNLEIVKKLGFNVEEFGNNSFIIRTVPIVMSRQQDKNVLLDVIDELHSTKVKTFDEVKEKIITRMACRAAVKQGDEIGLAEVKNIIKQLYKCNIAFTCPHGRPVIVRMTISELEKKFRRRV